ncbi:hypothetical protein ACFY36_05105 [Actinoplanes sp. NPDC000266]
MTAGPIVVLAVAATAPVPGHGRTAVDRDVDFGAQAAPRATQRWWDVVS